MSVPVLSGPLRGLRWITGAGTNGCWLGVYESDKQKRLVEVLKQGDCFLDIGANVGFYTLLAAKLVGPHGHVAALEPFPPNFDFLTRHVALNGLTNVSCRCLAISDGAERMMAFEAGPEASMGRLSESGSNGDSLQVSATSLDALWDGHAFPAPSLIKIDVEGAEHSVLAGGEKMIRECQPVILLAGHGTRVQSQCCELLRAWNYELEVDRDGTIDGMYETTAWHRDLSLKKHGNE